MSAPRRCAHCHIGQLYLDRIEDEWACLQCGWRQSVRGPLVPLPLRRTDEGTPRNRQGTA